MNKPALLEIAKQLKRLNNYVELYLINKGFDIDNIIECEKDAKK